MDIKIKYHDELFGEIERIQMIPKGDWVDLRAAEDVDLKAGEHRIISFGISMQLPINYEAHIAPRSSTYKKWFILQTNSVGVVDESYCGNDDIWGMTVYAVKDTSIKKGDRIAQFRIMEKQPQLNFIETDNLEGENRGGFGSTGTNEFVFTCHVTSPNYEECRECGNMTFDDGGVYCKRATQ